MAASAAKLRDLTILHHIGLTRYSRPVINRILKALRETQADIEALLTERLAVVENSARDPRSLRLNALLEQVRRTQTEAHAAIRARLETDIDEMIEEEADWAAGFSKIAIGADANLATVSAAQLRAAVMAFPFQGLHLREWMDKFEDGDKQRMRGQIMMGYLEGESVPQIMRRIRIIAPVSQRGAEMMVRTSLTHINSRAVRENIDANPDLFPKYQWVSVLDNRTTPICRAHAGKVFARTNGPIPPAHPNCRSTIFPLVKGVAPAEDMGFDTWLNEQDAETQRDVLGASRFKLWSEGKMTLDRFVDGNQTLTLEQLRKRDAAAFQKAGL